MSKQFFEKLLNDYKRSNLSRKEITAKKAGYENPEEYKNFLEKQIKNFDEVKKEVSDIVRPTIHIVDILDCSTSMLGSKIDNASKGINSNIIKLKQEVVDVNYTYTLCDFGSYNDIKTKYFMSPLDKVQETTFIARGCTALCDAIGTTLKSLKANISIEEKVLVNIYTDGDENNSTKYKHKDISELIDSLKDTFTVTFVGTELDVKKAISDFNIAESNTLVYDGTGTGLEKSLILTNKARTVYANAVVKGEDVSLGFYKKLK